MENASFVIFAEATGSASAGTDSNQQSGAPAGAEMKQQSGAPAGADSNQQSGSDTTGGKPVINITPTDPQPQPQPQPSSGMDLVLWLPFIILIGVMFAISIRTSSREKKKREEMMNSIRKGTKVMTSGGIFGEIAEVQKDTFLLKIANNVQIAISRTAIAQVIQPAAPAAAESAAADDTKTEVKKK